MTDKLESAPELKAFLDELVALCAKHGAELLDCGCCGGLQVKIKDKEIDCVTPIDGNGLNQRG